MKIVVNQTIVQHKPLLTRSGYWSTLQPEEASYRVFAKQMTNPPAACGLPTKSTIDKSATTKSVQDDATPRETPKQFGLQSYGTPVSSLGRVGDFDQLFECTSFHDRNCEEPKAADTNHRAVRRVISREE
ncbi:MAG: hypothetical protein ABSF15_17535 [Candidatus Sulfotelmatobacter sp.]